MTRNERRRSVLEALSGKVDDPMLRFPNPGSDIANFVAVYVAAYKDLYGRVIGIDDLVQAAVNAGLASSSGHVGEEAVKRSTRLDRSRDPLYNQMKMYAELFRVMGWLHPTPDARLRYGFTLLGKQFVEAGDDYWPLLERCVLGIAYPTRALTVMRNMELRPFAFILNTMMDCGGYLSRDEMIIGPLSAQFDRDSAAVREMLEKINSARKSDEAIKSELENTAEGRGIAVNSLRNYTRWPIAVLRDCGWATNNEERFADGKKYKVWKLTESGKDVAIRTKSAIDLRLSDVESLDQEEMDAVSVVSHFRMLDQTGFDITPMLGRVERALPIAVAALPSLKDENRAILFSPFQSLSTDDIEHAFRVDTLASEFDEKGERAPINAQTKRYERSDLLVVPKLVKSARNTSELTGKTFVELNDILAEFPNPMEAAEIFCNLHSQDTKLTFYPLVAKLFEMLGFRCELSRHGVNYQRWDACVWIGDKALPVEIKSPSEELKLATKAVRQALENKIVILSRGGLPTARDVTSLIVGFQLPNERGDMSNLIEDIYKAYGLNLGVIDLCGLAYLAARKIQDGSAIDADQLAHLRGFIDVRFRSVQNGK